MVQQRQQDRAGGSVRDDHPRLLCELLHALAAGPLKVFGVARQIMRATALDKYRLVQLGGELIHCPHQSVEVLIMGSDSDEDQITAP